MHALKLTLPTLAENLALDEALLLEAEAGQGGEVLRLWEWPRPSVVLGAGGKLAEDVDEAACLGDHLPIGRRSSGGGTVLLGPGCLLYSLVLAYERHPALQEVRSSYCHILHQFQEALGGLVPGVACAGTSDLAVAGRKFSGNSQQRKRDYLLHHGTVLYDFDIASVSRYLRLPARQPEYRAARPHEAFLANLPLTAGELESRLRALWSADQVLDPWPEAMVRELVTTRYSTEEWLRRR
jgi:lipoate-protein ligase A